MKKTIATMMTMTLAFGIATSVIAKSEKKNAPRNTAAVEKDLKEAGSEHFPEKMKVGKVGPIKVGDTYYHAFCGNLKKSGYRVIIYDNTPKYMGYYETEFEPYDYEEGAILLDSGESDEDGNDIPFILPLGKKGPADRINIDGIPTTFVKAPGNEGEAAGGIPAGPAKVKTVGGDDMQPEYRDWTISMRGKKITFRAIYIKKDRSKVFLKDEKQGNEKDFYIRDFSKADQEYMEQFK
ncbi:hypothetical protein [Pontiella sulfatireligans]|uniref:Uncharacterized protein n=1 Tax=Pontiella sulfatireligans TaxID=2750658 RepID=A0A6C2USR8_9BACT|nr:hypothetical protein [Pontiella sulfatireligans]VGO23308.1 hypothetical protein SCARR_05415 [Pontiella sulfatireligans]